MPISFHDESINFYLEIPDLWHFNRPEWSPIEKLKRDPDSFFYHAKTPFCTALKHHELKNVVYPTLQATIRPPIKYSKDLANSIIQSTKTIMAKQFDNSAIIDESTDGLIGGCRANILKSTAELSFKQDNSIQTYSIINHSYTIFSNKYTFVVGLSGNSSNELDEINDFISITKSIRCR